MDLFPAMCFLSPGILRMAGLQVGSSGKAPEFSVLFCIYEYLTVPRSVEVPEWPANSVVGEGPA